MRDDGNQNRTLATLETPQSPTPGRGKQDPGREASGLQAEVNLREDES